MKHCEGRSMYGLTGQYRKPILTDSGRGIFPQKYTETVDRMVKVDGLELDPDDSVFLHLLIFEIFASSHLMVFSISLSDSSGLM